MGETDDDLRSDLFDVTKIDLDVLAALADSVMGAALLRITREMADETEPFSGFQQSV